MRASFARCSRNLRCSASAAYLPCSHSTLHKSTRASSTLTQVAVLDRPTPDDASTSIHHETDRARSDSSTLLDTVPSPAGLPKPERKHERPIQLPPMTSRSNPAAWASLVEPYLPLRLKSAHPRWPLHPNHANVFLEDLPQLVLQARQQANIDVLANIAIEEERWEAMLWMADVILQLCKNEDGPVNDRTLLQSIQWPTSQYLDDWTSHSKALMETYARDKFHAVEAPTPSLTTFTNSSYSTAHAASWPDKLRTAGLLWMTAGRLILKASEQKKSEASTTMKYALRLLGQLHYHGYIPPKVYYDPSPNGIIGVRQPDQISQYSNVIMSALLDAVIDVSNNSADRSDAAAGLNLAAEVWMEFVLWCCVRGGWLVEASSILNELRKRRGKNAWHLLHWREIESLEPPTDSSLRRFAKRLPLPRRIKSNDNVVSQKVAAEVRFVERTVSSEVVVALTDALAAGVDSLPLKDQRLRPIFDRLSQLRDFLHRDKLRLGQSTWDEVVIRFADLPQQDIDSDPRLMEMFLVNLSEAYAASSSSTLVEGRGRSLETYSFIGTAAALGLFHRVLRAHIRRRDSQGALRALKALLDFTDTNKQQAVRDFAIAVQGPRSSKQLQSPTVHIKGALNGPMPQYPAFFPSIPPAILADLMSLSAEDGDIEIGHWMLHSQDVDGPLIPPILYSNETMAPAILRFAIETSDTPLLSKVMKAQSPKLSGKTMIAICESRLRKGRWEGALHILNLMKDFPQHVWEAVDLVSVVRPLLPHVLQSSDSAAFHEASAVLQNLLRGEFGHVWGHDCTQVNSLVVMLSTIDRRMSEVCSTLLYNSHMLEFNLDEKAFDIIFEGCVSLRGSGLGMRLWKTWCDSENSTRDIDWTPETDAVDVATDLRTEQFSAEEIQSIRPKSSLNITGYHRPSLNLLRCIIKKALREMKTFAVVADRRPEEGDPMSVLSWATAELQTTFRLSPDDTMVELEGHTLQTIQFAKTPHIYRPETVSLWESVNAKNADWLQGAEQRLRDFVRSSTERQMDFEVTKRPERRFLHELSTDCGLFSESYGVEPDRGVTISKIPHVSKVPTITLSEWCQMTWDDRQAYIDTVN